MNVPLAALRKLEAHLQEEIGAQQRVLVALDAQRDALLGNQPTLVVERTKALEDEAARTPERTRRRAALLAELANAWHLAPGALSLSSIVERAGPHGDRVGRLRQELRAITARVVRESRRVGALARLHQRVFSDALDLLFEQVGAHGAARGGQLLDAEA